MRSQQSIYLVAVLATDNNLAHDIASAISCDYCIVLIARSVQEVHTISSIEQIDLIIVATTSYSTTDNIFYGCVQQLMLTGSDIFVITSHHSVRHTLHLLHSGVKQCMTLPIATERLRRKVYEHLATKSNYQHNIS